MLHNASNHFGTVKNYSVKIANFIRGYIFEILLNKKWLKNPLKCAIFTEMITHTGIMEHQLKPSESL